MSVSAGIGERVPVAALFTHIHMIAKCASPAMFNIVHDPVLLMAHPVLLTIRLTIQLEYVRYLVVPVMRTAIHLLLAWPRINHFRAHIVFK